MSDFSATNQSVKLLYDQVPYATYDTDLFPIIKALGMNLKEFAGFARGKKALEVGCGGGHITAFLSEYFDQVTGADISDKSLELAKSECAKRGIGNVNFIQGNLFDKSFQNNNFQKYDFVLCYGVLHHTKSPAEGFSILTGFAKAGSMILIGVYSRTQWLYRLKRKIVLSMSGGDWERRKKLANRLWFGNKGNDLTISDGYVNPQVSFHSVSEVYGWGQKARLKYTGSWPCFELQWYVRKILNRPPGVFSKNDYKKIAFFFVELIWALRGKSIMVTAAFIKQNSH